MSTKLIFNFVPMFSDEDPLNAGASFSHKATIDREFPEVFNMLGNLKEATSNQFRLYIRDFGDRAILVVIEPTSHLAAMGLEFWDSIFFNELVFD